MNIKTSLSIIGCTSWTGLGFIRGINSYKYNYNKYEQKKIYLYLDSVFYGFCGVGLYANPLFLPITLYKEIYRLEVNLRNLEHEKKTDNYNNLFL